MTITPLAAKETPNGADSNISEAANVYICNTLTSASGLVTLKTSAGVAIATFDSYICRNNHLHSNRFRKLI